MINKRGKLIALGFGGFFILLVIMDNMDKDSISKDSFYENYNTSGESISLTKKKKTASLQVDEETITESSESYKQQSLKRNKKDKAFSLYREILDIDKKEVEETVVENLDEEESSNDESDVEEAVETKEEPVKTKVVYVPVEQPQPRQQTAVQEAEPSSNERTFKRSAKAIKRTNASSTNSTSNTSTDRYIKAEIYRAVTVNLEYPSNIEIRVTDDKDFTLPNGKVIKHGTMLKGAPSASTSTLDFYIPSHNLELYDEAYVKGIPLTEAEGLQSEADKHANTELKTRVSIPLIGSTELSSGKKKQSAKVKLNEGRTIYLKWKE